MPQGEAAPSLSDPSRPEWPLGGCTQHHGVALISASMAEDGSTQAPPAGRTVPT